jgi:hypothetical protein
VALFLFLLIAAIALGLIGGLAQGGLFFLLFVGILVFLLDVSIAGWLRTRRRVTR